MNVRIQRPPEPPSAVLIDVGNTRVGMASWYGSRVYPGRRLTWPQIEAEPAWLSTPWNDLPAGTHRYAVVSSVSPPTLAELERMLRTHCDDTEAIVVGRDIPLPMKVAVAEPDHVGSDRVCAAAAAYGIIQGACVVASFGTALTVDLVSDDGVFMGGAILPGMKLAAEALHEHTALLPLVEIETPQETWGTRTDSAIRVGVFCSMVGTLRELAERYATHVGKWPPLVVTGGDAQRIADEADFIDRVVPDLCLQGVALALEQALAADDAS